MNNFIFNILIIILIGIIVLLIFVIKNKPLTYEQGYKAALKSLEESKYPAQTLYDQCQGDDPWDRGWMDACLNNGAKSK